MREKLKNIFTEYIDEIVFALLLILLIGLTFYGGHSAIQIQAGVEIRQTEK